MILLPLSLHAWKNGALNETLKQELCTIDPNLLPLQKGLRYSSFANGETLSVSIIKVDAGDDHIRVKVGLFYTGIIAGCNCADDPTPVDENNEYCEALLLIDKLTAETTIELSDE